MSSVISIIKLLTRLSKKPYLFLKKYTVFYPLDKHFMAKNPSSVEENSVNYANQQWSNYGSL